MEVAKRIRGAREGRPEMVAETVGFEPTGEMLALAAVPPSD